MHKVNVFITGSPGSGKSTLILKIIEQLKLRGLKVGGIITPEFRIEGRRIAFKIVDIASGAEEFLASISFPEGPRIGKYRVNIEGFENVALPALDFALNKCDIICIDELGRMEFFSRRFIQKVDEAVKSDKPLIAAVHRDYINSYRGFGVVLQVTPKNRNYLVTHLISQFIGKS